VVRLSPNSAVHTKGEFINRALHIERDPGLTPEELVHQGAMQYLHSIRGKTDQHDFLVVDVILQDAAMQKIAKMLLSSTVWFDATNGAAFAAHHDDGLVFKSVHTLVQVLCAPSFVFNDMALYFSSSLPSCNVSRSKLPWRCRKTTSR
jgi:hypothetical protein